MTDTLKPKFPEDIAPRQPMALEKEPADDYAALNNLAHEIELRVTEAIHWYLRKKKWPSRLSRWLRGLAIGFAVLGGLAPLLSSDKETAGILFNADRWGYILIALAGAFLLFDRYFGFSTSWMRYMTAQMALQKALERFQLSWAVWRIAVKNQKPTDDQHNSGIALLNNFQQQTAELIEKEFQIWVTQFQEQLTALQAAIDKDRKERYPGNLVVTFHAQTAITGPADIYLNNRLAQQTDSGSMLFSALNPETYLVQVKANKGALQGSKTVKVESGQTSEVSIELKTVTPGTTIP